MRVRKRGSLRVWEEEEKEVNISKFSKNIIRLEKEK